MNKLKLLERSSCFLFVFFLVLTLFFLVQFFYFYQEFKSEVIDGFFLRTYASNYSVLDFSRLESAYLFKSELSDSYKYLDENIFFPLICSIGEFKNIMPQSFKEALFNYLKLRINLKQDNIPIAFTYTPLYSLYGADLDDTALTYTFIFQDLKHNFSDFNFNANFIDSFNLNKTYGLFEVFEKNISTPYNFDFVSNIHFAYYCSLINCSFKDSLLKNISSHLEFFLVHDDFYDCSFKIYRLENLLGIKVPKQLKDNCYEKAKLNIRWLYIYSKDFRILPLIKISKIFFSDLFSKRQLFYIYAERIYSQYPGGNFSKAYIFSKAFEDVSLVSYILKYVKSFLIFTFLFFILYLFFKSMRHLSF